MKFISPSWNTVFYKSIDLSEKIRVGNWKAYDSIVGVSRGGLVLTRLLSDLLDIEDVMITKCEYYSDLGERRKHPVITQKIQGDIKGKKVLLADDVSDTGESLKEIKKYLLGLRPTLLSVATLYLKPWSAFTPDYYASKTDAWIIFPWEPYEALRSLSSKNGPEILKEAKISEKLVKRLNKMDRSLLPKSWQSAIGQAQHNS